METYNSIKLWKEQHLSFHSSSNNTLNQFHDHLMGKVLSIAINKIGKGHIPCQFTWFITGSGGREEQGLIADQDHGIIYSVTSEENKDYFLALGDEISYGLSVVGYPYCKGNIMSSNPVWCNSFEQWKGQIENWILDESWEKIRYLQIFYDARALYGELFPIRKLKSFIHSNLLQHSYVLKRIAANMQHMKNSIGPIGQLIVEQHGPYQGFINLKYAAFIPYVNSIRLLSMKESIEENSTLKRIESLMQINPYKKLLMGYDNNFRLLLKLRMVYIDGENYDDTHYLNIKKLTTYERRELKRVLKEGKTLHDRVLSMILHD